MAEPEQRSAAMLQADPERTLRPPHVGGGEHEHIEDRALGHLDAASHVQSAEIQFRVEH